LIAEDLFLLPNIFTSLITYLQITIKYRCREIIKENRASNKFTGLKLKNQGYRFDFCKKYHYFSENRKSSG